MVELSLQKQSNSLIAVDPAAVAMAEASKARIQAAYIMAMQKPRNEDVSLEKIIAACKRINFAKSVEFEKPVGKKKDDKGRWVQNYIKGLSIRFAEVALKEWGNLLTETQTLYEDEAVRRIRVGVLDLETNTSFSKEIQITKIVERKNKTGREVVGERLNSYNDTVYIVKATDDELMNKENALISKAVRNEGLRLIPNYIKEEAVRIARLTIRGDIDRDPNEASKKIVDSFLSFGIASAELEKFFGHGLDTLSAEEIEKLRGIYRAISDGEATWTDYAQAQTQTEPTQKSNQTTPLNNLETDSVKKQFDATFGDPEKDSQLKIFLSETAKANGVMIADIMKSALENVAPFRAAFNNWKSKQDPPTSGPGPEQNQNQENKNEGGASDWSDFVKSWVRLHSTNFKTFVIDNLSDFERAPEWVKVKAKRKYSEKVGEPWPSIVDAEGDLSTNTNNGNIPEGHSKPEAANVQPGANDAADITQSDEWNEISMLQERYPDIYSGLARGRALKTVADLSILIEDINNAVNLEEGGSGQNGFFDAPPTGEDDIPH